MNRSDGSLLIRNATAADAELLCAWWNDGAVMAHAGFPLGLGTTAEKIRESLEKDDDAVHRRCILEHGGAPIGEMNYRSIGAGAAEVGIKICEASEQNKGLGTRALRLFFHSLFADYGYEKIVLDTNQNNLRAQHVYEKLGFRRLRLNENAWTDQLGVPQSSIDYELSKADFYRLNKANLSHAQCDFCGQGRARGKTRNA